MNFSEQYLNDINKATNYLKNDFLTNKEIDIAIILWSGLGDLANELDSDTVQSIDYNNIPGFPKFEAVEGHSWELLSGVLEGKNVVMMKGRYHYYEYKHEVANPMKVITLPIRVFQKLGIPNLIVSNAAGWVENEWNVWDVMLINDHINLMWDNPLLGRNIDALGQRFSPMTTAYDINLRNVAKTIATDLGITLREWVYMALSWTTYETPAEYDMVKRLGAHVVGMSTVPEVIVANHGKHLMKVLGLSVVTNLGGTNITTPPSHKEVIEAAAIAMPKMVSFVKGVVKNI